MPISVVTGAAGFVGQALVRRLRADGDEVRALALPKDPCLSELRALGHLSAQKIRRLGWAPRVSTDHGMELALRYLSEQRAAAQNPGERWRVHGQGLTVIVQIDGEARCSGSAGATWQNSPPAIATPAPDDSLRLCY